MIKVKRALISVSDKKGLIPFARGLKELGVDIISTGGTARQLKEAGIPVKEISDHTGFPEMLDGRVKTLHPKVHGGLLALRGKKDHMDQVKSHGIDLIDMVVVNLYPFESVVKRKNVNFADAIENIDIGGPSMLRSGAKNFKNVAVICNPAKYKNILKELQNNNGLLSDTVLFQLAVETFTHTAHYDTVISGYLKKSVSGEDFSLLPANVDLKFSKIQDLRYGENPHQAGAFYKDAQGASSLSMLKQHHGKELSFNNILDLNAALDIVKDFKDPTAVVIKHNNPTGVAQAKDLSTAYKQAWQCDSLSAFGGIIGLNRKVDAKTAQLIKKSGFMECVIAPGFAKEALTVLQEKKNIRLVECNFSQLKNEPYDFKQVYGGLLLQQRDARQISTGELKVVSRKKPTKSQLESMLFGWQVIRHVRSNAILLVKGRQIVGIGCGQTSRVESVKIAIEKAGKSAKGSVLISDAFLPKTDNVEIAAKAGISAIIHTGGSIADKEVLAAADKLKIALVTTGVRHFKH